MLRGESDAEIIRKTLAGNRHAFEALIQRYNRMAYAVAFARLGNHQDAEDAAQEGWLQAFSTLNRLRDPERFPAWLAIIVRNVSVNAGRNRWRRSSLEEVGDTLVVDFRESMENADIHRALWAQIATMTPDFREVLTLHYHAGLSTEEIADWTGLSRETVKKRLQRARSALSE
ncbi:MAG: sigma-70 family RNA polymerase sigma factor, partial [Candidatus Hydrogenedentes bacterium]|nr:sigma-70 family RNA polymerase sigma factor [Candidatus Hydrogenedentota bacterium]